MKKRIAAIGCAIACIGLLAWRFLGRVKFYRMPQIIEGTIMLRYEYSQSEGSYADLSRLEDGVIGYTIFDDDEKIKMADGVIIFNGDIELYIDGYVALGDKSFEILMARKYKYYSKDGNLLFDGENGM